MSNQGWSNTTNRRLVVVEGSVYTGLFFYQPTAAAGNLVGSWTAEAGEDPYGNAYPAGINVTIGAITGTTISGATITGSTITGGTITGGTFLGTDFIINDKGIFFYSGTPAAGNLIGSIANTSGSDTFGNAFPLGMQWNTATGTASVVVAPHGIQIDAPFPQELFSGSLAASSSGAGATASGLLAITSPQDNVQLDVGYVDLPSSSNDGVTSIAGVRLGWRGVSSGNLDYLDVDYRGARILAGSVTAPQPGTGGSRGTPAVAETWHTVGTTGQPAFGTGFTNNGAADQAPRYRLEGIGGGVVRLDGTVITTAAVAAGATMFTLPVGYRPATNRRRFVGPTSLSGYALGNMTVGVATSGAVTIGPLGNAAGQQIVLDNMSFPID